MACLTGHTVSVNYPDFIWQEKSKASHGEWARVGGGSFHAVNFRWSLPACPSHSAAPFLISLLLREAF